MLVETAIERPEISLAGFPAAETAFGPARPTGPQRTCPSGPSAEQVGWVRDFQRIRRLGATDAASVIAGGVGDLSRTVRISGVRA
jgi:hypothetical protein